MKHLLAALSIAWLSASPCWADGDWRFTETVDSAWAGTVQLKWNSTTGQSFHSIVVGTRTTWLAVLQNIAWTPIAAPVSGWKTGPAAENRFQILPHLVFGHNPNGYDQLAPRRHGVFLVDSYSGAAYVMTRADGDGVTPNFPYDTYFPQSYWTVIEEAADLPTPPTSTIGRYEISSESSSFIDIFPRGWPYVTRLDRVTGRVDVAVPQTQSFIDGSDLVRHTWYRIAN